MESWIRAFGALMRLPRPLIWGIGAISLILGGFLALWFMGALLVVMALGVAAGAIYGFVRSLTAKKSPPKVIELKDYRSLEDERE